MRILSIHDRYKFRGGEESSVASERRMLEAQGHDVIPYDRDNREIVAWSTARKATLFVTATWNPMTARDVETLVRKQKPDIAHVHNTQPLISPSVYWALARTEVPVVQTLHNYRLFCPAGTLFRNGQVCEECLEHSLHRSIQYRCYRGSRIQTMAVAQSLWAHRVLGTWAKKIDRYVALTEFGRRKFIECGIPDEKIEIKPHFLELPPSPRYDHDGYAIFVGRLSTEKGLLTLLRAWRELPCVPLRVIGEGPLGSALQEEIHREEIKGVEILGPLTLEDCLSHLRGARFLVFPSEWYEGLPRVIIEAYACGKPVIASRIGATAELVMNGLTGLHFNPGDPGDLVQKVRWMTDNDARAAEMGRAARQEFERRYTEERNYELLMGIYRKAVEVRMMRVAR